MPWWSRFRLATYRKRVSSYQQLLDGGDIYRQVGDEAAQDEGAGPAPSQLDYDVESAEKTMGGTSGVGSVGATVELSASEKEDEEEREPGLLGSDGLLAMPHVKIVLFLGCIISVRGETTIVG